jgi:uncharacterized protein (DUF1697 family)
MDLNNYVIFLRGVNVGGNATLRMDLLKKLLLENNYLNVKTYINSGNLLVSTPQDKKTLADNVKEIIKTNFGLTIEMIIKTKAELNDIIAHNPYDKEKETDNSKRVVAMLSEKTGPEKTQIFKEDSKITENYYTNGDLIYIYYHDGAGRSKFTNNYIEKKLKVTSTARNWNTILKMNDL